MHVWRVETVDGIGPFHHWALGKGLPLTHVGAFRAPLHDTHDDNESLRFWLREGMWRADYQPDRDHGSATLVCGMPTQAALRGCFETTGEGDTSAFTVTCYEVAPLYCILLKSQILFDRRFATIVTRVSY